MKSPFHGSLVALPTPFRDGQVDYEALQRQVERQIAAGTDGLVATGTTGEAATLSEGERLGVIELVASVTAGRVPVMAGIGTNATAQTCRLGQAARLAGADGLLAVTPYYNRPTQRGLLAHFGALARAAEGAAIVLYNVPARTGVDLLPETVAELAAEHPNIVAIKEASGSLERIEVLVRTAGLDVLCGEDHLIAQSLRLGAVGAVSVVGNVLPAAVAELVREAAHGTGDTLTARIEPLIRALFLETNPAPLKAALALRELDTGDLREPLVPVTVETRAALERALGFVDAFEPSPA